MLLSYVSLVPCSSPLFLCCSEKSKHICIIIHIGLLAALHGTQNCVCICTYVHTYTHTRTHMHTHTRAHTRTYTHACACALTCTNTRTNTHIRTHIDTHVHELGHATHMAGSIFQQQRLVMVPYRYKSFVNSHTQVFLLLELKYRCMITSTTRRCRFNLMRV